MRYLPEGPTLFTMILFAAVAYRYHRIAVDLTTHSSQPANVSASTHLRPFGEYDEAAIVKLITEIYRVVVRLGGLQHDEIVWPPEDGHQMIFPELPTDRCLDPGVNSLMRKMPYTKVSDHYTAIAPNMRPVNYLDPQEIRCGRFLRKDAWIEGHLDESLMNAASTMLLLFATQEGPIESYLMLDIEDNSVRQVKWQWDEANGDLPEDVDEEEYVNDFLNWPKQSALAYFQQMLDNYLTATWIPARGLIWVAPDAQAAETMAQIEDDSPERAAWPFAEAEARRIVLEDYGWPHSFREEDWKRDGPAILKGLAQRSMDEWLGR